MLYHYFYTYKNTNYFSNNKNILFNLYLTNYRPIQPGFQSYHLIYGVVLQPLGG